MGTATSVTANGFIANWTPVSNAVSYDVKIYLGENLISTTNTIGQTTDNLTITGLTPGLTYTYKVIAKGNITNYSDSNPSAASSAFTALDPYAANTLNTNFDDSSWGEAVVTQPTSGTYPSGSINGFDLSAAVLYSRTIKGIKGETHNNRIAIDKQANGGKVTLPTVNSVEQIEIHASAGSEGNGFVLKEFIPSTNTWAAIGGTYVYDINTKNAATDSIYIISVSRSVPTKFRIENPTNGGIYLMQVITRTTNPALLAKPTIGTVSAISPTSFTANWTAVPNATGYKVYVYQGTTLLNGTPFSVNGQSTETLSISNLSNETAYTFKVQAIGDNYATYSDSFLSIAGSVTTSTTTGLSSNGNKNLISVSGKSVLASEVGFFEIFNLQGLLLLQANNVQAIDNQLSNGLYLVKFTNKAGQQSIQKVVIR
ncbi:MAG: fibronectin type III domain-containing protein [Paludibacter sp.]